MDEASVATQCRDSMTLVKRFGFHGSLVLQSMHCVITSQSIANPGTKVKHKPLSAAELSQHDAEQIVCTRMRGRDWPNGGLKDTLKQLFLVKLTKNRTSEVRIVPEMGKATRSATAKLKKMGT